MLAHHLKRLAKPVRYAMDPAHEQAIRNYLAIASRAQDVPGLLRHNFMQTTPWTQQLGKNAPLAGELIQSFTGEHDPGALGGLLDLLDDHGFYGYQGIQEVPNLIHMLQQLHRNIASYGQGQAGAHPAVIRGYGEEGLQGLGSRVADSIRTPRGGSRPVDLVRGLLESTGRLGADAMPHPAHFGLVSALNDVLHGGDPRGYVRLHDLAGRAMQGGNSHQQRRATGVQNLSQQMLANVVHPALWHYGEHGEFPQ